MILGPIPFDRNASYRIKVKLYSSQEDKFQIFFSKKGSTGYPFSEANSLVQSLKKGVNDFVLMLENQSMGELLRVDPGQGRGAFVFHGFVIEKLAD